VECQGIELLVAAVIGGERVRSRKVMVKKQPPKVRELEQRTAEQRVWFPPDFQDFETAMEVTAYAGRR
jgi:coenzyme PQQ precursor peptide PqqA